MEKKQGVGIIVDLASDNSCNVISQITTAVKNRLSSLASSNLTGLPRAKEVPAPQNGDVKISNDIIKDEQEHQRLQKQEHITLNEESGEIHAQEQPYHFILLSKTNFEFDKLPIPFSKVIVSDDYMDLLFKAKTRLDESPGFGCGVQVVTSAVMKKFWETACVHVFSPATTWSVWGVPVTDQALGLGEPVVGSQVENLFREYLKTVGDPDQVNVLRSDAIPTDQFNAGFHDRFGGVSQFPSVASMNMIYTTYKPDPVMVVEENRRRLALAAGFDLAQMHVVKAEHAKTIWVVGQEQPARYDGIVTDRPGVTVCAPGADCCVILLADTHTGAVGVVHAGWRGTTMMAVNALLHTMELEFGTQPAHVRAAIGPSVSGNHYVLRPEDAKPVADLDPTLTWPSKIKPHLVHIDLVRANVVQLIRAGVPEHYIDTQNAHCTFENKQFFSCERDGKPFGNQLGFISCRRKRS
ncbi:laccase domain-containing protein 1 [Elysia marginata]|uniref:Laccase domain-containing protein 1 n=1 Tax=Elysia marginata TaxID=1093978 RepID=A0AAV4GTM6_9GAST|nr:laccase domain-containing protein 1 [Elysia marginata]